ncbi:Lethal(3)malignant brain tumor-like 1, partial [Dryobates pubescens]
MDSRAEMEVVRSTKGSAPGEVSVHVVTTESTVQSTHLPTTAFIIPANATTINLPSSALEIQRFPREPQRSTGAERPERGAGGEPITAAVIPQISGVQACSTVRVLEWKDGVATLPGSNLRFRINEYGTLKVVSADKMPAVEAVKEGHREKDEDSEVAPSSRDNASVAQGEAEGRDREAAAATGTQLLRGPGPGGSASPAPCRSVIVENSASSTIATEILKPVKKRKRKDYQSPSEEEYESEQMEEKQEERKTSAGDSALSNPEPEAWNGSQHGASEEKKEGWSWASYLEEQKAVAAPLDLFQDYQVASQHKNGFKVGMKLEGIDPQHPSMYFILTVAEVCGYRMRLHFDGYSECHDFWLNADSPDIHPAGWFEETGHKLQPPQGYKEEEFSWTNYLKITKAQAAPKHLFVVRNTVSPGFEVGMKLEAVDRMNPSLICVATVTDVVQNRFLVHFD